MANELRQPKVKVIGVEPELASDARASLRAGRIVSFPAEQVSQTLADGLRTQSIGAINFEHIRAYVDDIVSVTEDEIREAMRALSANAKTLAEPSGAVAVAAFLFHADELPKTAINVAVISGGNIDPKLLPSWVIADRSSLSHSKSAFLCCSPVSSVVSRGSLLLERNHRGHRGSQRKPLVSIRPSSAANVQS